MIKKYGGGWDGGWGWVEDWNGMEKGAPPEIPEDTIPTQSADTRSTGSPVSCFIISNQQIKLIMALDSSFASIDGFFFIVFF